MRMENLFEPWRLSIVSETQTKTISKVTRLAGAILAETNGEYYLVGELKEPCDFSQHGFEQPIESLSFPNASVGNPDEDVNGPPTKTFGGDSSGISPNNLSKYKKLKVTGDVLLDESEFLEMETQGEQLAELLFKRFVILRNHSVSDRLWRVVTSQKNPDNKVDARWLEQMPDEVWEIVRESVLKCR